MLSLETPRGSSKVSWAEVCSPMIPSLGKAAEALAVAVGLGSERAAEMPCRATRGGGVEGGAWLLRGFRLFDS